MWWADDDDGHMLRTALFSADHFAWKLILMYVSSALSFRPRTDITTATIKCEKTYEICEGCSQKIHDRYYLRVAETNWHEACLTCNICHLLLNYKCYVRNSKLYCKDDYYRWERCSMLICDLIKLFGFCQSTNNYLHSKLIAIKMHRSFNYANLIFQPEQNIRHQVQSLLREN